MNSQYETQVPISRELVEHLAYSASLLRGPSIKAVAEATDDQDYFLFNTSRKTSSGISATREISSSPRKYPRDAFEMRAHCAARTGGIMRNNGFQHMTMVG